MYSCLAILAVGFLALLIAMFIIEWRLAPPTIRGRAKVLRVSHRLLFLFGLCIGRLSHRAHGRALAFNAVMTPFETSRGTEGLDADVVVSFRNAVVKTGSDDRHFTLPATATDIPRGIVLNDQVDAGEPGVVRKQVAIFGLYADSLPGVAAAAIAVNAELVADLATPGYVKALPGASGTYVVFGRSRFAVATAGDPVSIIHCLPRVVVIP